MPRSSDLFACRSAAITCALLATLVASSACGQTTLRWQFKPGQILRQVNTQETKSTVTVGPQTIDTTMTQTTDIVWTVGEVDAQGVADVVLEINRVRFKMSGAPGMEVDFDSSSTEEPSGMAAMIVPAFKAMVNAKLTTKVTPQGEFVEPKVSEETLNALKSLPGMGQMGNMVTADSLVAIFKQGTAKLPADAVQSGGTWADAMEMEIPQLGKISSDTQLTYVGTAQVDGRALEQVDMTLSSKIAPSTGAMAKIELKDQTATGKLYFDNAAGRLSHSEVIQNMTIAIEMLGQSIDQKMQQTIRSQLTAGGAETAAASPSPSGGSRTWKDATGQFSVVAEFVSATADVVTLRKESGDTIQVPISRLSEKDRAVVAERSSQP